ncbi:MAG: ribonuclease [Thermoplasmata archaeon]|nr:ribonuclease [Thermoplasmata archaeon]
MQFEEAIARVEGALGHRFTRRDLLREALTTGAHAHGADPGARHHGRLAFLGDAVIYLIVTRDGFDGAPEPQPTDRVKQGPLHEARKARIENDRLTRVAASMGLELPVREGQADDAGLGHEKRLATAIEAIVGALYEDTGRDLERTARIVLPFLARAP